MAELRNSQQNQKALSVRQLTLLFLVGMALCGVFFAMGFVVGYNERSASATPEAEHVATPDSVIPPTVNPPLKNDQAPAPSAKKAPAGNPNELQTERISKPQPASSSPPPQSASQGRVRAVPSRATAPPQAAPAPPPAASVAGKAETSKPATGIVVQVAAMNSRQDADNLVSALKTRGYTAFVVTPEQAHAGDNLFRVQVGPFTTRQDAESARKKLVGEGFQPFIRH